MILLKKEKAFCERLENETRKWLIDSDAAEVVLITEYKNQHVSFLLVTGNTQ
jgi:hypothetical protein